MTRISSTLLGRSGYSENPCSQSYFLHKVWYILWIFCRHSLLCWGISFFFQIVDRFINVKKVRFCQMLFLPVLKWLCNFYALFYYYGTLCWLICISWMIPKILHFGDILTQSIFIILFMYHWIPFVSILLRIFVSIFIRDVDL